MLAETELNPCGKYNITLLDVVDAVVVVVVACRPFVTLCPLCCGAATAASSFTLPARLPVRDVSPDDYQSFCCFCSCCCCRCLLILQRIFLFSFQTNGQTGGEKEKKYHNKLLDNNNGENEIKMKKNGPTADST